MAQRSRIPALAISIMHTAASKISRLYHAERGGFKGRTSAFMIRLSAEEAELLEPRTANARLRSQIVTASKRNLVCTILPANATVVYSAPGMPAPLQIALLLQ
jgi:hypothetical protein